MYLNKYLLTLLLYSIPNKNDSLGSNQFSKAGSQATSVTPTDSNIHVLMKRLCEQVRLSFFYKLEYNV